MKTYTITCDDCGKEFGSIESCTYGHIIIGGKTYTRNAGFQFGKEFSQTVETSEKKCSDCGVEAGKIHHYGCGEEVCPACKEKLATCECEVEKRSL
ncbi:MAG: hypothetical protein WC757_04595 [Candidatus Paceibacterota bacterium]|jgi:hypothetical protein